MDPSNERFKYYMPLTSGAPQDGPSRSIFSVPRANYSPETQAVVKNLMRESRLTFTQKHVFDTILRDGKSLPERPSQMNAKLRQMYMQQRHKHKARLLGMSVMDPDNMSHIVPRILHIGPHRRSLDAITASGVLEPPPLPRSFIPASKEIEKDRLANRMAFGKDFAPGTKPPKSSQDKHAPERVPETAEVAIEKMKQQRFEELIDEIQDRMQFLLTMDKVKMSKPYKDCIINQINEKLHEMRVISPEKERDVRDCLQLEVLDKRLSATFAKECKTAKFFDQ